MSMTRIQSPRRGARRTPVPGRRSGEVSRPAEALYQVIVDDLTEVVSRFRADGTILLVNDVYCRVFGGKPEALIGRRWQSFALPDDLPMIEGQLRSLTPDQPVIVIENRIRSGDGEARWMQFVNRGFFDEAGRLREVQSVGRDITERKRVEGALRASEERLSLALSSSRMGVWEWEIAEDVVYWSPQCFRLFGVSDEAATPASFWDRVHPDDVRWLRERVAQAVRGEVPYEAEFRVILPDGRTRWMSNVGRVNGPDDGRPRRMVGIVEDITDRKEAALELESSRKALRKLASRIQSTREEEQTRLAREVHDQLGHAFTDLKLDLAWLDRRLAREGRSRRTAVRRKLAAMMGRVEDQLGTVRRISEDLRPAVLDSLGLVAAVEWAARRFERRTGIRCRLELPENQLTLDPGKSTALFRIFQEILSNVARHSRASRVRVLLLDDSENRWVRLEVTDDGRGITREEITDPGAMGLLAMRERALEFGGEVSIEGGPAVGTTVRVRIPRRTGRRRGSWTKP